jgi:surfeit locus 1 family protein
VWYFADVEEMRQYFSGEEEDQDTYTPSHGVAESVKSMLGLESSGGTKNVLPVYMEQIFEGNLGDASRYLQNGLPIGRAATVELRNQHAVYAATWFSLSAATSVMLAILIRKGPKA